MIAANEPVVIMTRRELEQLIEQAAMRASEVTAKRLPTNRPPHVNQTQAAEMLHISRATISNMIRFGTLSLNDCGMIPIEQIDKAIEARAA